MDKFKKIMGGVFMGKTKKMRVLCIATMVFLLGSSLAGCKGAAVTSSAPSSSVTSEVKLEPVTIVQYLPLPELPDLQLVVDEINKTLKDKINATLVIKAIDRGSYAQKMSVITASREDFDICFTAPWLNNYYTNVNNGALLALDNLITKYAPNAYKAIPQKYWDAAKVNGKLYGFLNYQIYARTDAALVLKDIAAKYKFDTKSVKKWADFEPLLKAVHENEKDMLTMSISGSQPLSFWTEKSMGLQQIISYDCPGAIKMDDTSTTVINQWETQEFKDYFTMMRDWYTKGYFLKDIATADVSSYTNQGKCAIVIEGTYKPGGAAQMAAGMSKKAEDYDEIIMSKTYATTSGIIATMQGISQTSKNPERALMYLEIVNTNKDIYNLLCFGIKDKDYKVDADGYAESIPNGGYDLGMDWALGNQFNALLRVGTPKTAWEDTIKINEKSEVSPITGFSFDPTPVSTEIAQCQAVSKEYIPILATGVSDPVTKLPEFLDKIKKAGGDKIIAEIQKQINAWKKANGK